MLRFLPFLLISVHLNAADASAGAVGRSCRPGSPLFASHRHIAAEKSARCVTSSFKNMIHVNDAEGEPAELILDLPYALVRTQAVERK